MASAVGSEIWGRTCYAVDAFGSRVVVVRGERRGGRIRYAEAEIGEVIDRAPGRRRVIPVVAALSPRESFTRWLATPFVAPRKAIKVTPTLLDIQLPFALEDCVHTILHLERSAERTIHVLAAGARLTDIRTRIQFLQRLGVDPVILDQEGVALWTQSLEEMPPEPQRGECLRVVVFLTLERSVVAVGCGSRFENAYMFSELDGQQLRRILLAHRRQTAPSPETSPPLESVCWFWAGPGAQDSQRIAALLEEVGSEHCRSSAVHEKPGLFLARALTTRALTRGPLRCNLRIGPESHPEVLRRGRRTVRWAASLLLVAGLLLVCGSLAFRVALQERVRGQERRLAEWIDRLAGFHVAAQGDDAMIILGRAVEARKQELLPFKAALEPSLLDVLAETVRIAQRNGLRLDTLLLSRKRVTITGVAPAYDSCRDLEAFLTSSGYKVALQRKPLTPRGLIPFEISAGGATDD
ncbi:MAG: hypothetical protein ACUVWX_06120 [Kiritimatiellia bacterium]